MRTNLHIKREVERMTWPETIPDPEGDLLREIVKLQRRVSYWRTLALFWIAVYLVVLALTLLLD